MKTTRTRRTVGLTRCLLALALAVSLGGCEPERGRWGVWLQPDGAGRVRVIHETAGELQEHPDEPPPSADDPLEAERARVQAARFLSTVEGVSAWSDIVATPLAGGRTRVEATGWFRSLADLRVLGEPRFSLSVVGQDLHVGYLDPLPAGLSELFLAERSKLQQAFDEPDERFAASLHRTRGFVEMSLAGWEFALVLRLPGEVADVQGFERAGDDRVALRQDVESVLELLDADLQALREVRAEVRRGALTFDQGAAALAERLASAPARRVRCQVPASSDDPAFDEAYAAAQSAWKTSEWRRRVDQLGLPK